MLFSDPLELLEASLVWIMDVHGVKRRVLQGPGSREQCGLECFGIRCDLRRGHLGRHMGWTTH